MLRKTDWIFGLTVLAAVAVESYAIALVVAASFGPTRALLHGSTVTAAVVRGLNLTALNAIAVTLVILLLHVVTSARRERRRRDTAEWLERLANEIADPRRQPGRLLPRSALEALLELRNTLDGSAGAAVADLLRGSGLLPTPADLHRTPARFARLDGLEILGRARLPETLPRVYPFLTHRDPMIRFAAARAAARIADAATTPELAERLAGVDFNRRAWLDVVLLVRTPVPLVAALLARPEAAPRWAALEAVGRRHLLSLVDRVVAHLDDRDDELLAAALRALAALMIPPAGRESRVLEATGSPADFVRLQAVRVVPLLAGPAASRALWERLADPSFYVRQAAAEALRTVDATRLRQAAASHPDRYGRAMARQESSLPHAA